MNRTMVLTKSTAAALVLVDIRNSDGDFRNHLKFHGIVWTELITDQTFLAKFPNQAFMF